PNQRSCAQQNRDWPVKTDRPAERLFVDNEDQNEGKKDSQQKARKVREQAKQPSLGKNKFANLDAGGSKIAKQAQLPPAIDYQSEKGSGYPHDGYYNGDSFECISDRKSAIKDLHSLLAKVGVCKN